MRKDTWTRVEHTFLLNNSNIKNLNRNTTGNIKKLNDETKMEIDKIIDDSLSF